jgi:large subunit ribosomal protein L13
MSDDEVPRGEELESHLKQYLRESIEDVDNPFDYLEEPRDLPEGSLLTRAGLINHNKDSRKVRGGRFEADAVIDASYCVYGRIASRVAERALDGWKIAVVNVENAVITGNEDDIISTHQKRRNIGSDQEPIYPKKPDRIFKRAVRGMLPYKKPRGREALDNVRAFLGNPYQVQGIRFDDASINKRSTTKFVEISELGNQVG